MHLSKEYVGYLAKQIVKRLNDNKFIKTDHFETVNARVEAVLLEEISMEDRINEEVRVILEAYAEEMRKGGVNYQEMFKKVKNELVRKYRAVL
jgi:hypothetical protein